MNDPHVREISPAAHEALITKLRELETKGRDEIGERLRKAREQGDLSENSEYDSAMQDQGLMESKISEMKAILNEAQVRSAPADASVVGVGVKVLIQDAEDPSLEETYLIADASERLTGARVVTPESPLGSALMGAKPGDEVSYSAPGGTFRYKVLSLQAAD